jgi:pimeloyl-ACP methyl ester carboxylesterase
MMTNSIPKVLGGMALLLTPLLAGNSVSTRSSELPRYEAIEECFTEIDIDLDYECGYVTVPAFYDGRNDSEIRLAVYRIFATGEGTEEAPIFFLEGGPGASMKTLLSVNNYLLTQDDSGSDPATPLSKVLENHDLVMMSQRGTEFSQPAMLTCPDSNDFELIGILKNLSEAEEAELRAVAYQSCIDEYADQGIDLNAYNNYANADDVNAVRQALGYDQIIVYGTSYGAQLAQFVMQRHPEILAAAILDGANALSKVEWEQDNGVVAEEAIRRFLAMCAADQPCASSYEDPQGLLDAAIEKIQAAPLQLDYYSIEVEDDVSIEIDLGEFSYAMELMANHPSWKRLIPFVLDDIVNGDAQIFADLFLAQSISESEKDSFPVLMHLAMVCSDDPPQAEISFDQSDESMFASSAEQTNATWYADGCAAVDVEPLGPETDIDVTADIPTLLFSGGFDLRTPPFRNQEVADHLPNSRVITFEYGEHIQYVTYAACVGEITHEFVSDPSALDSIDASCTEGQSNPYRFLTREEIGL